MRLPNGIVVALLAMPLAGPEWSNFMEDLNEAVGLAREQEMQDALKTSADGAAEEPAEAEAAPAEAEPAETPSPEPGSDG